MVSFHDMVQMKGASVWRRSMGLQLRASDVAVSRSRIRGERECGEEEVKEQRVG